MWQMRKVYCISSIRHRSYHCFHCSLLRGYYSRVGFVLWKVYKHQQWLDKVCMGDNRFYRWYMQPLSSAVSRGNKSHNMNSPSASLVTVVSKYSHMCVCVCVTCTSHSYYSRPVSTRRNTVVGKLDTLQQLKVYC